MSKKNFGLRKAGFASASLALALGGTLVATSPASAATDGLTAPDAKTGLHTGGAAQPVGNLEYTFTNNYSTGASVTLQIAGNDCSNASTVKKAVEFDAVPTATATVIAPGTATAPTFTAGTLKSSSTACSTAGITDKVTYTTNGVAPAPTAEQFKLAFSGIAYNVGDNAVLGDVTVVATGTNNLPTDSAANAAVVGTSLAVAPFNAAQPSATGNLGDITLTESGAGASFTAAVGSKDTISVSLDQSKLPAGSASTFDTSAAAKPTATVSAGHSVAPADITVAGNTITVLVKDDSATTAPVTLTIKGAKVVTGSVDQLRITSNVTGTTSVKALNVVDSDARFGGADRYSTAAKLFNAKFQGAEDVVLSSGQAFPDALGANYLAGQKATGLLLTKTNSLPEATRVALINSDAKTVYITGGPAAVSQTVQSQIDAMDTPDSGDPAGTKIKTVRLGGDDRYDTNRIINQRAAAADATHSTKTVLMASGVNFPDALALGPVSYNKHLPLILSNSKTLSTSDEAQLADFDATRVVIAGGTNAVSTTVETAITAKSIAVNRIDGADRQQTAVKIATWATEGLKTSSTDTGFLTTALGFGSTVGIATGFPGEQNFADALAAGSFLGEADATLLLTKSDTKLSDATSPYTANYLGDKVVGGAADAISTLIALGGTDVVSNSLINTAAVSIEK